MSRTLVNGNVTYLYDETVFPQNVTPLELESFFDRARIQSLPGTQEKGGRGKTLLFTMNGKDLVLRHYRRGGLFGKLVKDRFSLIMPHAHRAFDEFKLLENMSLESLPVPKPVIAREENAFGFIRQDIVIERLNGFRDISFIIDHRFLTKAEFSAIGKTLKHFFDKGIMHTDLNIRNILLNEEGDVFVIDFDKCWQCNLTFQQKKSMISRLLRSFNKEVVRRNGAKTYFNEIDFKFLAQETEVDA